MGDEVESLLRPVMDEASALITKSTVAVLIAGADGKTPQSDSTGVLVQIGSSHFLFTVAHSISGYVKDGMPIFAFGGMSGSRVVPLANSQALNFGSGGQLDAAVLRLAPGAVAELSKTMTFLRLGQMEVDHSLSMDHCYLVTGFPGSEFEPDLATGEIQMDVLRYVTSPYVGETKGLNDFNPSVTYAFDYNQPGAISPDGTPQYMPSPYGMSGGGIWSLGHRNSYSKFKPDAIRLVAIEFGYYGKLGPIMGTKLGVLLSLIYRTYPELRSAIDLHPRVSWPNCPGMFV